MGRAVTASSSIVTLLLVLAAHPALADSNRGDWALCRPLPAVDLPAPDPDDPGLRLIADKVSLDRRNLSTFTGNVLLSESGRQLRADQLTYREAPRSATARGGVVYRDDLLVIAGDEANLDLDGGTGDFIAARYRIDARHANGTAARIERLDADRALLTDATYTTCDPEQPDWHLRAGEVRLDRADGVGTARDVSVRLGQVPIFYFPYVSFPLDGRRKSGFLPPRIGVSDDGLELEIPYYWNIAPHRDATITPHLLGDRGLMLRGEFRYLNPQSAGLVGLEYLPDDDRYGADRHLFTFRHGSRLLPGLNADIDISAASDGDYLRDFGNSLNVSSTTHLERRADLRLDGRGWNLLGRVQDFQTLDPALAPADRPYQRLPQLLFTGQWPLRNTALPVEVGLRAEWVSFVHDDAIDGRRLDLMPSLSVPYAGPGWHFTPELKYRHTAYRLDGIAPGGADAPTRNLPVFSLDSGLEFERPLGDGRFQTLEPRLHYLNVPYENQDAIPLFDTGLRDFGFTQMFLDNRFSGADRVGDANQLAVALTTRIIDGQGGEELLRAGIGQVFHFRDREVTLDPGDPPATAGTSAIVTEAAVRITPALAAGAAMQWSPARETTENSAAWLRYRSDGDRVLNLAYRFRENDFEQTDFSAAWPLSSRWRGVARWNYSLRESRDIETFAGLEYESCCWRFRAVARRYLVEGSDEYNDAIYFQLILKGLTSIGPRIDSLLEEGILGYESD